MLNPEDLAFFDDIHIDDLRLAYSAKWNMYPADVLPLWVADMDFPIAPEITHALKARLDARIGYPPREGDAQLAQAIIEHQAGFGWYGLEPTEIVFIPGVVPGFYAVNLGLTAPGEEIITQTPIYPPFLTGITDRGRVAVLNPLLQTADGWKIDFDQLETLPTDQTKLLMLCNPHNPTGRVWSRTELERLASFVSRYDLYVMSDELHADLIFDGSHTPFASLSAEMAQRTITITGPCKTYSTAGLGIGVMIAQNPKLLARVQNATKGLLAHPNSLSLEMWLAGLKHGGAWLEKTRTYLRSNRDFVTDFMRERLPMVKYNAPEGTYLAWLDFRDHQLAPCIHAYLLEHAKVGLNDGPPFGSDYQGCVRLNFGTSRAILSEALERIAKVIND